MNASSQHYNSISHNEFVLVRVQTAKVHEKIYEKTAKVHEKVHEKIYEKIHDK